MTEIMPAQVRATSFSFAYNIAVALFGGFTPAISTFLIHETGNAAIGGVWLSIAAACSLAAALLVRLPSEISERTTVAVHAEASRPAVLARPKS